MFGSVSEFDRDKIVNAFHGVFEMIGGKTRLALWANENPGEFYKLYAKLFPSTNAAIGEGNQLTITLNVPPTKLDQHDGFEDREIQVQCHERLN